MGYRGSKSEHASSYKKKGHEDEEVFANLIGGRVISGTGKKDVVGLDNKTYSVKGGTRKWQIFLYGKERFKKDNDFNKIDNLGNLFIKSLDSFPEDYSEYSKDKKQAKKKLKEFARQNENRKPTDKEILDFLGENNEYLNSKNRLQGVTKEIADILSEKSVIKQFLLKSIFNMGEVDYWSIKEGSDFFVYNRNDVLEIFADNLEVSTSKKGSRRSDLNIDGQKVIFRYKSNIVEIEVRNDSPRHYKQIRFNMIRIGALELLKENTSIEKKMVDSVYLFKKR